MGLYIQLFALRGKEGRNEFPFVQRLKKDINMTGVSVSLLRTLLHGVWFLMSHHYKKF
jgi:hypothetical protein